MLPEPGQHVASGHLLEGFLEVRSDQDAGLLFLSKILDVFDHLVGSIWRAHTILNERRHFGHSDRFGRPSAQEGHHEERSVSLCGFGKWQDLAGAQVLEDSIGDSKRWPYER